VKKQFLPVMAAIILVSVMATGAFAGQAAKPAAGSNASWTPPRTPDGQPDMQGIWSRPTINFREEGVKYPAANAGPDGQNDIAYPELWQRSNSGDLRDNSRRVQLPTGIIDPPDKKLPWRPEAFAARERTMQRHLAPRNLLEMDPFVYCAPPAPPRMGAGVVQIRQTRNKVFFMPEYDHLYRVFPLDGRPHLNPAIRLWQGNSRGRWEGNTLVVETRNFNGRHWFDLVGHIQSDAMKTTERFTLVDPDTIKYEVTVDDPKLYTKPWTAAGAFIRMPKEDGREIEPLEYACAEGSRGQVEATLHAVKDKLKR
jgi:hypothetical protein